MLVAISAVLLSSSIGLPIAPSPWQSSGVLNADVVIHTYMDYQCRFCRQQLTVMQRLVNRNANSIRWVSWLWPSNNIRSQHFAKVGYCVGTHYGNSAFTQFNQQFYALPPSLHDVEGIAMRISLQIPNIDKAVIEHCLTAKQTSEYFVQVNRFAQQDASFVGTPGMIIQVNGTQVKLQGFQSSAALEASIKKAASRDEAAF